MAKERKLLEISNNNGVIDEILTGPANKAWRALILINRNTSGMRKAEGVSFNEEMDNNHLSNEGSFSLAQGKDSWQSAKIASSINKIPVEEIIKSKSIDYTKGKSFLKNPYKNDIIIVNTNTSPATCLTIQNRPNEISIEPVSTWASVKSFGRNDPFQIYNGSEKSITFDISWYSIDSEYRDDVVTKCKLLESWTKSDGYKSSPPLLRIQWGKSGLFDDDLFILTSASYKLTHFQDACLDKTGGAWTKEGIPKQDIKDLKLLPNHATQTLVFKKVTNKNTTYNEMVDSKIIKRTLGISQ